MSIVAVTARLDRWPSDAAVDTCRFRPRPATESWSPSPIAAPQRLSTKHLCQPVPQSKPQDRRRGSRAHERHSPQLDEMRVPQVEEKKSTSRAPRPRKETPARRGKRRDPIQRPYCIQQRARRKSYFPPSIRNWTVNWPLSTCYAVFDNTVPRPPIAQNRS